MKKYKEQEVVLNMVENWNEHIYRELKPVKLSFGFGLKPVKWVKHKAVVCPIWTSQDKSTEGI